MTRVVTYGRMPTEAPEGTFRRFRSPNAASLDVGTRESWISRKLSSDGGRVLDLPRTMSMQYVDDTGHLRSVPAGAIHEATIDGENGVVTFAGWLADTPDGHLAERVIVAQALRHNSIDIGDVPPDGLVITEHGNFWEDDFWLEAEFVDWALAKSTIVATPAFKNAFVEADALLAAMGPDDELIIDCPTVLTASAFPFEIMASMSTRPSWNYFNRPEADIPHPIIVDEPDKDGWVPVYGHLAQWRKMTRDSKGVLRHPPRGYDNYANFMKPKAVLTDNGWAAAGPITLLGGHVSLAEAAAKVENVWADVHVVDGKHGPWVCGVMRPHIAADEVETYRARASQISGYWSGGVMRLISSVPAPGYPITASEEEDALVASFNDEQPAERGPFPIDALCSFDEITPDAQARIRQWVEAGSKGSHMLTIDTTNPTITTGTTSDVTVVVETKDDDFAFRQRQRGRELALQSELV